MALLASRGDVGSRESDFNSRSYCLHMTREAAVFEDNHSLLTVRTWSKPPGDPQNNAHCPQDLRDLAPSSLLQIDASRMSERTNRCIESLRCRVHQSTQHPHGHRTSAEQNPHIRCKAGTLGPDEMCGTLHQVHDSIRIVTKRPHRGTNSTDESMQ